MIATMLEGSAGMAVQVWTGRHPQLHQTLPLDDYPADHNAFEAGSGHKNDSAHEDSGTGSGAARIPSGNADLC